MIKKIAPMLLLLGVSAAPLAWGQDERGSENEEIQTSDESAIGADDVLEEEAGLNESDDAADTNRELTDPEAEDQPGSEVADAEDAEADTSELTGQSDGSQSADEANSEVAESVDPAPNPTEDVLAGDAAGKEGGAGHDSSVPDASAPALSPAPTPPKSPLIQELERLQQDAEASRGTKESNAIRPHTPKD